MKKILGILAFALLAAGCSHQATTTAPQPTPTPTAMPTPTPMQLQTYKNGSYGFSFQYPLDVTFQTPNYANLNDKIAELVIPRSAYPGTNFGDAAFSVSAQYTPNLSACLTLSAPENSDGFKTQVKINGTTFYMTKGTGAGAGNLYASTTYRTLETINGGQACLEVNETIHTSNIQAYPTNTVTQVDTAPIQARLDAILNTFKVGAQ